MNITIRPETKKDYLPIREINDLAFKQKNEGLLIEKLRETSDFISELSLVAEFERKVVGHLLLYPVKLNEENTKHTILSLGPMSVHPNYQRKGIGSKLVREGLKRAKEKGYGSVIVIGHPRYYPRFGFSKASKFDIKAPFDAPDNAFMALELVENALENVKGLVEYPKPFSETL